MAKEAPHSGPRPWDNRPKTPRNKFIDTREWRLAAWFPHPKVSLQPEGLEIRRLVAG